MGTVCALHFEDSPARRRPVQQEGGKLRAPPALFELHASDEERACFVPLVKAGRSKNTYSCSVACPSRQQVHIKGSQMLRSDMDEQLKLDYAGRTAVCVEPDEGFTKNKQVPFASSESFVMRTSNLVQARCLHIRSLGECHPLRVLAFQGKLSAQKQGLENAGRVCQLFSWVRPLHRRRILLSQQCKTGLLCNFTIWCHDALQLLARHVLCMKHAILGMESGGEKRT